VLLVPLREILRLPLAAEKLVDLLGVRLGDGFVSHEATGALAGLALHKVAPVRLLVGELARPGYLEPLLRTAVRLLLRHGGLLLNQHAILA